MLADEKSYQPFLPREVGAEEGRFELVLGRHSGTVGVLEKLAHLGIRATRRQAREILLLVREHAVGRVGAIDDVALLALAATVGLAPPGYIKGNRNQVTGTRPRKL
jgi:homocitrate synthase NifV